MRRLYFDLLALDSGHRAEITRHIEMAADGANTVRVVDSPQNADLIVAFGGHQVGAALPARHRAANELVWSSADDPSGLERGLYCSLRSLLFSKARHETFCYPIKYNETIEHFDQADAPLLFTFVGGVTSGLRARILKNFAANQGPWECRESGGPWNAMFDRSGLAVKRAYSESMRRAKFVLCPRGNGVGSIRLFETMEAGRVPVIISDAYIGCGLVNWSTCALQVRESDIKNLPIILAREEHRWEQLAVAARATWERCFSPGAWADSIDEIARKISGSKTGAPNMAQLATLRLYGIRTGLGRAVRTVQGALRKRRGAG